MSAQLSEPFPPIEWDDGYPTDASLEALKAVYSHSLCRPAQVARYLRKELAKCAEVCVASYDEEPATDILGKPVLRLLFSTGGWSGAEDLIDELLSKFWIAHHHVEWRRGGHFVFEVPSVEEIA